jgi:hypothetical protein
VVPLGVRSGEVSIFSLLFCLLLVQTVGFRLWPVGMADVGGLRRSCALFLDL